MQFLILRFLEAKKVNRVFKVLLGLRDLLVRKESKVFRDLKENKVLLDLRDLLVRKVNRVFRDLLDLEANRDLLV